MRGKVTEVSKHLHNWLDLTFPPSLLCAPITGVALFTCTRNTLLLVPLFFLQKSLSLVWSHFPTCIHYCSLDYVTHQVLHATCSNGKWLFSKSHREWNWNLDPLKLNSSAEFMINLCIYSLTPFLFLNLFPSRLRTIKEMGRVIETICRSLCPCLKLKAFALIFPASPESLKGGSRVNY